MDFAKEIAGPPGLTRTSVEQSRKVPTLTGTTMLTILNVIVDTLFIPITPTLRIGFSSTPAAVCGIYYGPICTDFAGVITNTLKYVIRPDDPYSPRFAINEFLTGMIYGCFFYKKKIALPRMIIARACITVFINLVLTPLWLDMIYQSPLSTMVRLIKNVMMFPVDVALLYTVPKGAERIRRIQPCNIEKLCFEW